MDRARLTRSELDLTYRFAAFLSELLYINDDLQRRLELIEDGPARLKKLIDETSELIKK